MSAGIPCVAYGDRLLRFRIGHGGIMPLFCPTGQRKFEKGEVAFGFARRDRVPRMAVMASARPLVGRSTRN
ncbi:hypothetical protein G8O24_12745 [Bradyrhizobium sp. INPA01-394B]|uniref:Uncharacterized protein n=1 Tax=Bradyrhizobium campsiandrae TaxID=1729892 RepID=A0ABR7UAL5_9BRAD|nr:hypothetical protein [Bradyrhizobium campsiandrae]MBC9878211.1 hypothetical protein [Bradyrhizobium campsiandrae]MBC9980566.1 hypothetical protein [Bradyrhizobium campsiandrae]